MRAIVVGCRGFVGSAVVHELATRGVDVIRVDRESYASLRGSSAELLVNASGSSDRRLPLVDPMGSFKANVDTVLATLLDFEFEIYLHVSTVAVYPDASSPATTREDTAIRPEDLSHYGFEKYLAEMIVRRYATRWVIVRLGALVGPGLRKNSVFDLLSAGTLYVHPESQLTYVDTRDVARVIWALRNNWGEVFNVGGSDAVSLADVARELGIELDRKLWNLQRENVILNSAKVLRHVDLPDSISTIRRFAREWRGSASA